MYTVRTKLKENYKNPQNRRIRACWMQYFFLPHWQTCFSQWNPLIHKGKKIKVLHSSARSNHKEQEKG